MCGGRAGWLHFGPGSGVGRRGWGAGTQAPAAPENVIWASGKLLPVRWAAFSPATGGTVKALYPAEGHQVEAGTLLAEIDNSILQSGWRLPPQRWLSRSGPRRAAGRC